MARTVSKNHNHISKYIFFSKSSHWYFFIYLFFNIYLSFFSIHHVRYCGSSGDACSSHLRMSTQTHLVVTMSKNQVVISNSSIRALLIAWVMLLRETPPEVHIKLLTLLVFTHQLPAKKHTSLHILQLQTFSPSESRCCYSFFSIRLLCWSCTTW